MYINKVKQNEKMMGLYLYSKTHVQYSSILNQDMQTSCFFSHFIFLSLFIFEFKIVSRYQTFLSEKLF